MSARAFGTKAAGNAKGRWVCALRGANEPRLDLVGRWGIFWQIVDEEEIEIGAVPDLATAKLSHRDDAQSVVVREVAFGECKTRRLLERRVGQSREAWLVSDAVAPNAERDHDNPVEERVCDDHRHQTLEAAGHGTPNQTAGKCGHR